MKIASASLRELYAYWDGKRRGRDMPSRADLDPVEVPRLLPNLLLFEVEPETNRLRVRLTGTRVVELHGKDYKDSYLDQVEFGDQRQAVLDDYRACLESKRPHVGERSFSNIRGFRYRFERLILPLSDDDRVVSMLLSGLHFHEVREV